jgi:hypothetical protein
MGAPVWASEKPELWQRIAAYQPPHNKGAHHPVANFFDTENDFEVVLNVKSFL